MEMKFCQSCGMPLTSNEAEQMLTVASAQTTVLTVIRMESSLRTAPWTK